MNMTIMVIILVVVVLIVWNITTINKINKLEVKINEANSSIDVALTKRYDVLTKMIATVKGYTKHEEDTMFEVVNLRNGMSIKEMNQEYEKMNRNVENMNVVVENYPDLKANSNFQLLQKAIVNVEEELEATRRMYNSNISCYNQIVVSFPTSIIVMLMKKGKKDFFEADDYKREDVKVEF